MIPVPKPLKLAAEDLDPKPPEWLPKLLSALNGFVGEVIASFTAASREQRSRSVDVQTGETVATDVQPFPIEFRNELDTRPRSVWVGQVMPLTGDPTMTSAITIPKWSITDKGLISIPFITGLPASTKLRIVFEYR